MASYNTVPETAAAEELLKKPKTTIVGQGAKMGIPGSGNSREFSGIPGVRYFTPGERDLAAQ